MITPYWHMNCHSLMYVTSGQGRVQIINHRGQTVFDGTLHHGQIVLIPQNYAVLKRAEREMFQWVSFNTNHNAMISQMVGKNSVLRAMPLQVLMHSYRLSMEQARRLKFSRQHEMTILSRMHEMRSNE
jgi:Cupin